MKNFTLLVFALLCTLCASAQVTPPEGSTIQYYTRSGQFYSIDWDGITIGKQHGCVGVIIDGNDVYIQNLVQAMNNDSWTKGTIGADGKTVTIPADNILMQTSQWIEMPDGTWPECKGFIRLSMLKFSTTDEGTTFVRDEETPIQLTLDGDNIILENTAAGKEVLGGIYDGFTDGAAYLNGQWHIGADYGTELTKFDEKPVTVPEDAVGEDYQMCSIGAYSTDPEYNFVKLYTVGDDIYVKGFYSTNKDYAIKGTRQGNKVHFEGPQFIGVYAGYILELTSCNYTKSEPDEWGWSDLTYEDKGAFDLTYDETTGEYTLPAGEALRITVRDSYDSSWAMYCDLTIKPYVDKLLTPQEPEITDVADYYDMEGDWGVFFMYSTESEEGEPLNLEHLSYSFYINDELYTFDAERYGLDKDMTEIPINLSGNEYINKANYWGVQNYILEKEIHKVGLQFIYRVGDQVSRSAINEYVVDTPDAISDINADNRDVPTYNLAGQRVSSSTKGIVIRGGKKYLNK